MKLFGNEKIWDQRLRCFMRRLAVPPIPLIVITLVGAGLRLPQLGHRSLWLDEAVMYGIADNNIGQVLADNATLNSAPPLFALLLRAVIAFNDSEFALRFVACVAGIAAIPAIYGLARQFGGRFAGRTAALMVAVAPMQVKYSQEVREYSLAFLLAVLFLRATSLFLRAPRRTSRALFLGIILVVSIFTQYGLAILVLACGGGILLALIRTRAGPREFILWGVVQFTGLIALALVYNVSLKQHLVAGAGGRAAYYLGGAYWDGSIASLPKMAARNTFELLDFALPAPLLLVFACSVGGLVIFGWRGARGCRRRLHVLLLTIFPFACTFALAVLRKYPYGGIRQCLFLTPMVYILMALGVEKFLRKRTTLAAGVVLAALLAAVGLLGTRDYLRRHGCEELRPVFRALSSKMDGQDVVFVYYGAVPAFRYYARRSDLKWVEGADHRGEPDGYYRDFDAAHVAGQKTWLVFSHIWEDEADQILQHASQGRAVTEVVSTAGASLYVVQ